MGGTGTGAAAAQACEAAALWRWVHSSFFLNVPHHSERKSLVDSARPRVSLEERSTKCSPRCWPVPGFPRAALCRPGTLSAWGGALGVASVWWSSVCAGERAKGPHVGRLWRSRGPAYSFYSWSSWSPRCQPHALEDRWCVAGPGLSGIHVSWYPGVWFFCHSTELPMPLPCTGCVGGRGCAGVSCLLPHTWAVLHPSLPHSESTKLTLTYSSPCSPVGWFLIDISQWEAPVGDWGVKGGRGRLGCFLPVPPWFGTSDLAVPHSSVTIATPGATGPSSTGSQPFLLPFRA